MTIIKPISSIEAVMLQPEKGPIRSRAPDSADAWGRALQIAMPHSG